ncbi:MAG: alpha/beta hydrolase-fold protein [Saprospiraceae bacterium]
MRMIRFIFLLIAPLLALPGLAWSQLLIRVVQLPASTPAGSTLYVAGSFNGWSAGDPGYAMESDQGVYTISLDVAPGTYEFKFTRGSWATVEGSAAGGFRPNRVVTYGGGSQTVDCTIDGWEGGGGTSSTAAANVEVLSDNFFMPQLNRNRKIWVYLPPDYYTTTRSYPVLYMHDGQNLFDDALSFSGEWGVDETLNALFEDGDNGAIVVGIENGGADRIAEYTPWPNPTYGGGEGAAYTDFLVQTLKPYVDANYRTLADRDHTGIMGSSLGGLISLYAAIRHQAVFGKAGVYSPSLWFTDDIYGFVSSTGKQAAMRIALLAGAQESASMIPDLQEMYQTLITAGFTPDELSLRTHADGQHSEWYWKREFGTDYQWLFQTVTQVAGTLPLQELHYWPNPGQDWISIAPLPNATDGQWKASVFNTAGQNRLTLTLTDNRIPLHTLSPGSYFIVLQHPLEGWGVLYVVKGG